VYLLASNRLFEKAGHYIINTMKIKVLSVLEEINTFRLRGIFDNVGLLLGDQNEEATGVLVCHDALENVINEAITKKCNLIVCFHPFYSLVSKNNRKKLRRTRPN
jgi:putative NIF3 family GTP cyclohydrolase 1 type 2